MIVRRATPADADAIYRMEREYIDCPWTLEQVKSAIDKSVFAVVELDGTVIGYASGEVCLDECDFNNVAVDAEYRRRGVADALMRAVMGELAERCIKRVHLLVRHDNTAAKALYEKYGFAAMSVRKGYYGGADAIAMTRII